MISEGRKASEAAVEVRSNMQLDHVLFHQCKQVADWLRVESSDPKNRESWSHFDKETTRLVYFFKLQSAHVQFNHFTAKGDYD